jgi:hypothetical protein
MSSIPALPVEESPVSEWVQELRDRRQDRIKAEVTKKVLGFKRICTHKASVGGEEHHETYDTQALAEGVAEQLRKEDGLTVSVLGIGRAIGAAMTREDGFIVGVPDSETESWKVVAKW